MRSLYDRDVNTSATELAEEVAEEQRPLLLCPCCGEPFYPSDTASAYCSDWCRSETAERRNRV